MSAQLTREPPAVVPKSRVIPLEPSNTRLPPTTTWSKVTGEFTSVLAQSSHTMFTPVLRVRSDPKLRIPGEFPGRRREPDCIVVAPLMEPEPPRTFPEPTVSAPLPKADPEVLLTKMLLVLPPTAAAMVVPPP
ncbi:MAG: hypothetical protein EBZ83_01915 [Verrucomicrobia bacterium]|nr:hypothetical protein [Verrucomicrobiota bacterium]